ncbi:MAG: NUDIX domain-containing protein [Chloroflexi bacterium]|nr:NUDIX domain-containing protein [Chloroflexota bacterium]
MKTRDEISAGGIVYRPREDGGYDIAIIRTHEGRWQLPKGWVEDGEPHDRAALREVREEAGVDGEVVGPIDTIDYWFNANYDPEPARVHKYVHFFLLRYTGGSTDDHDDEVTEARWVEIGEAERLLAFKEERRMVSMAQEALERAGG